MMTTLPPPALAAPPAPLFDSVRSALMFSFRLAEVNVLPASQCFNAAPTFGARVLLTDFEWHGQAALIRAMIARNFRGPDLALLLADYGCGRWRVRGARELAHHMAINCGHSAIMRSAVLRHFGLSRTAAAVLARENHVTTRTAERYIARVRDSVADQSERMAPRLQQLFVAPGICAYL